MYRYPSIRTTLFLGLTISAAYVVIFIGYLCSVIRKLHVLHGYPRSDLLPGPFVSDRYTWGWYFLTFSTIRGIYPFLYFYTLTGLKENYKRLWFERLGGYFIAFDIALFIFFTVTICILCNNTYFPESPCNDELSRWCDAFGDAHQDRCPPWPPGFVPLPQCELKPNPVFYRWIYFSIVFFLLDVIIWTLNLDMTGYVDRFMEYEYF